MSLKQATSTSCDSGQLSPDLLREAHKRTVEELRLLGPQMTFNRGTGKVVTLRAPIRNPMAAQIFKKTRSGAETIGTVIHSTANSVVGRVAVVAGIVAGSVVAPLAVGIGAAVTTVGVIGAGYGYLVSNDDGPQHAAILIYSDNLILRLELCDTGIIYRVGRVL